MSYRHIFDPVAAKEYEDAFKWYEERSFFAADNFILAVEMRSQPFAQILADTGIHIKI